MGSPSSKSKVAAPRAEPPANAAQSESTARRVSQSACAGRHKLIIAVLLPRHPDSAELITMAKSLGDRLHDAGRAPLVLFHETEMADVSLEEARQAVSRRARRCVMTAAVNMSMTVPTMWRAYVRTRDWAPEKKKLGYRQMCSFFFDQIFEHPALASATYVLRLDTDSRLEGCWPDLSRSLDAAPHVAYVSNPLLQHGTLDMVRWGHNDPGVVRAKAVGASDLECDSPRETKGLAELATSFNAQREGSTAPSPIANASLARSFGVRMARRRGAAGGTSDWKGLEPCVKSYYTNFEVIRLDAFRRSPTFQAWRGVVHRSGGIFTTRWGDAPLRHLSLSLMNAASEPASVVTLADVAPLAGYCHGRRRVKCWLPARLAVTRCAELLRAPDDATTAVPGAVRA